MRLLRALLHLVLALALVTATAAQARAVGVGPGMGAPQAAHHPGMADHAAAGHADPAGGHPDREHPVHKKDACQSACCFAPVQADVRLDGTSVPAFPGAVRYTDRAQPLMGRACPPEPGVPKRAA